MASFSGLIIVDCPFGILQRLFKMPFKFWNVVSNIRDETVR